MKNETEKQCKKCLEIKPIEDFYRDSREKDGYVKRCRKCIAADSKARYDRYVSEHIANRKNTLKKSQRPLKRSKMRLVGVSNASVLKREIQALVRAIVIKRDGGCLLRGHGNCTEILQGEHLITRANSATYGDTRNVICLCTYHHLFFKRQYSQLYWEMVEQKLGPVRWAWYKMARDDRTPHKMDWKLVKIALTQELERTPAYVDPRAN